MQTNRKVGYINREEIPLTENVPKGASFYLVDKTFESAIMIRLNN